MRENGATKDEGTYQEEKSKERLLTNGLYVYILGGGELDQEERKQDSEQTKRKKGVLW